MIKTLIFSLLTTGLIGQAKLSPSLLGSWKLSYYEMNGAISEVSTTEIISFYNNQVWQELRSNDQSDSTRYITAGTWLLEEKEAQLQLTDRHTIPANYDFNYGTIQYKVESVTDSTLTLTGFEGSEIIKSHYHRTAAQKRLADDYLTNLNETPKNKVELHLVNCADSSKKIRIEDKELLSLILKNDDLDSNKIDCREIRLTGMQNDASDSTITLNMLTESIELSLLDGSRTSQFNDYSLSFGEYRDIEIKKINYLGYTGPTKTKMANIGNAITGISMLTTLIVAPLVSIDYQDGGFNSKRYYMWAGAGLGGLSIGIPLIYLGKEKEYKLSDQTDCAGGCYWYLKKTSD